MSVWVLFLLLGVIKLPMIGLLLWMPFRSDPPAGDVPDSSQEEDGGSKTLPGGPHDGRRHPRGPLPRSPRRGPHGTPSPGPPERIRRITARGRQFVPGRER